jgi:hypothetical protein
MNENINDNCLLEVKLPAEFIRSPSSTSLNSLIKPSRFFLRSDSEFWDLTRKPEDIGTVSDNHQGPDPQDPR